jgi:multiple sugar transport system ATP-binding protein
VLELKGIDKSYGTTTALAGIDLAVQPGEILALAGPSGAGKTTTLHVAAGILSPESGEVSLDGKDLRKVPPWKRDVALVQESYALYPHMTVFDNIAFPLRKPRSGTRVDEAEIGRRVNEVAELLAMDHLLGNRIQHLSGGQRQRVALGRALVRRPQVFLLDEPISHLDAKLRHWLRGEVRRLLTAAGRPCIWTTPDGKEGLSVADRMAVIVNGVIVQSGTPREVFSRPATARVAEIISEPPIGILPGELRLPGPELHIDGIPMPFPLSIADGRMEPGRVLAGIRARSLKLIQGGHSSTTTRADVVEREFTTRETVVSVKVGEGSVRVLAPPFSEFRAKEQVTVEWGGAHVYLFRGGKERTLLCEAQIATAAKG